jgi:hypothetical protein
VLTIGNNELEVIEDDPLYMFMYGLKAKEGYKLCLFDAQIQDTVFSHSSCRP